MKLARCSARLFVGACLLSAFSMPAGAGVLSGEIVSADGKPVPGAIITVTDPRGVAESVYSDSKGAFKLETPMSGALELRIRKRYFRDELQKIKLGDSQNNPVHIELTALSGVKDLSEDHPSLSYFSRIKFDQDPKSRMSRENFTRDCLSCHQLGNVFTRWPRPAEAWLPTVQRMHGIFGNTDADFIKSRAELLAKAFDGTPVTSMPQIPIDPLLQKAKIFEWRLDGANVPHDAAAYSRSDKIYTVDMFAGRVIETDLTTGKTESFAEPAQGMPPGGAFTKMGAQAPYGLTVPRAPHSLAEGLDGKFYLSDSIGASIGVFNPETKEFAHYEVGGNAVYPHTIRVDKTGVVWATMAFSNQVGRFDPKTREMKVLKLPDNPALGFSCCTVPYGIDINPADGSVWYSKLWADKIGRIDATTLEIKEYDSPVAGPRRQRFDAKGNLWISGFSEGAIAKVDVTTWKSKLYKLPIFAAGEIPAPYAVAIHPQTQEVWINDTMLDVAWRFLPKEERFIAYPLPLKGTYTRDFTFTKQGWACTSNNPIPPAALEDGIPELICIDSGR
ncbi:virginiamycin B lyase family protein [Bradyrhizobium liaoningense]